MYSMKKFDKISYQVFEGEEIAFLIVQYSNNVWGLIDTENGVEVPEYRKMETPAKVLEQLNL